MGEGWITRLAGMQEVGRGRGDVWSVDACLHPWFQFPHFLGKGSYPPHGLNLLSQLWSNSGFGWKFTGFGAKLCQGQLIRSLV